MGNIQNFEMIDSLHHLDPLLLINFHEFSGMNNLVISECPNENLVIHVKIRQGRNSHLF